MIGNKSHVTVFDAKTAELYLVRVNLLIGKSAVGRKIEVIEVYDSLRRRGSWKQPEMSSKHAK